MGGLIRLFVCLFVFCWFFPVEAVGCFSRLCNDQ